MTFRPTGRWNRPGWTGPPPGTWGGAGPLPSLSIEAYHGEDIYVWNPNEITLAHMKKVNCDYTLCPVDRMPTPWVKALFHQDHETLLAARDFLQATCPGRYEAVFSNDWYLEITPPGVQQGGMVARLAGLLDVSPARVYCVGTTRTTSPCCEVGPPLRPRQLRPGGAGLGGPGPVPLPGGGSSGTSWRFWIKFIPDKSASPWGGASCFFTKRQPE